MTCDFPYILNPPQPGLKRTHAFKNGWNDSTKPQLHIHNSIFAGSFLWLTKTTSLKSWCWLLAQEDGLCRYGISIDYSRHLKNKSWWSMIFSWASRHILPMFFWGSKCLLTCWKPRDMLSTPSLHEANWSFHCYLPSSFSWVEIPKPDWLLGSPKSIQD